MKPPPNSSCSSPRHLRGPFAGLCALFLAAALNFPALSLDGQYVRVELPGNNRILTIAELEVFSGGKNLAPAGTAKQSSIGSGGEAKRAMDGNKDPAYTNKGQTHTNQQKNPWFELDLGKSVAIDHIQIWNRNENDLEQRLQDFTLQVLDAKRKTVFESKDNLAPVSSVRFEKLDAKKPAITYFGANGKKGKGIKRGRGSSSAPDVDTSVANVPADYRDALPFGFQDNDIVSILGNGLPDRFQHEGWFETVLQAGLKGKDVAFRNMSFSGDQVDKFPRNKGFTPMEAYLKHVKPTVIFAFFGYNESWDGAESAGKYTDRLVAMVNRFRGAAPISADGKSAFPRFVLFSPIAFENLKDPNLPNGADHNARLAATTEATRKAAEKVGVGFVDLYRPTLELFEGATENFTINGVHLNNEGNRRVAEIIGEALLGQNIAADASLESLRTAVKDKCWHWHNRFRAVDGNDVWGGRSGLRFVDDQSNRDVLEHELAMLDQMTANRDSKIWARASGGDHTVDDSNVPAPVPVISNVGGGSKSSNAGKEGNVKDGAVNYLTPEESLAKMNLPEGYKLNVFASEEMFPDLANPVQLQVDGKGRLWAASWNTYPKWEPMKEMNDSLMIFEDTDGDGVADTRKIFAKTHYPLGFEFWNGGVLVTCGPDLIFLKDTDGDDVADHREVMLMGLGTSDTHHSANNLIYGPDGGIYWQGGVFLVHNHEHPWGKALQSGASAMYRYDPRRHTITQHAGNSPNPHGTTFDHWGYCYANDGTGGRSYQVRPEGSGFKMHSLLTKEVRPVSADEIVSSTHFPDDIQGNFLVCNTIGYLGLKNYKLHRDGFEKSHKPGEVWGTPDTELLISEDRNFRPTDAIFGEDGALYISDWQNVIIGHMQHNIRDPNRDHVHGRVFRMTYEGRPLQKPVKIDGASIEELLENLKHPTVGVRQRTRVELSQHDRKKVIAAVRKWVQQFDAAKAEDAHPLLEALWVHQQFNARNRKLLNALLNSPEPHAVIAAKTVAHFWGPADPTKAHSEAIAAVEEVEVERGGITRDGPDLTEIRINTIQEKMKYDVANLTVKAGKKLKITFVNPDFMPHNIVFVAPGAATDIGNKAIQLGAEGFPKQWIPDDDRIFAASKLVDFNKEEVIEFTAPTNPGDYEYVCTFPGHSSLMRGILKVR